MLIRTASARALAAGLLTTLLLISCSRDPNARKQKYIDSGHRFYNDGKFREAAIQYANAVQIDPRDSETRYELAKTYMKMQSFSNAYRELTRTVELNPDNVRAQMDIGSMLLAGGAAQRAQEKAEFVLQKEPNNPDAHSLLANSYAARNMYDKANLEIQKAIEIAPNRAAFFTSLAFFQLHEKKFAEAEKAYRKSIDLDPKSVPTLESFARFYELQQKWPEAEEQLKRAVAAAPSEITPRIELARLYMATNRQAEAERMVTDTRNTLRDNPAGYRLLADFYTGTGQTDKALAEFSAMHAQHPKDMALAKSYAHLLLATTRYQEARDLDNEILKADPKDSDGIVIKGQILNREGHPDQAVKVFEGALKNDADNPTLHYYLGNALISTGDAARAETEWREAVRLQPALIDAHQKLATLAAAKGNIEQLALSGDQLIKALPASPDGYIFRARAEVAQKQIPSAEADLKRAGELAPRSPEPYTRLGQVRLFVQNRPAEAEKLFQQALVLSPSYQEALEGIVTIYLQQKQLAKALAAVNAQIEKAPNNSSFWTLKADLLARSGNLDEAEAAAQKASALDPSNLGAAIQLGQIQTRRGKADQALASFQRGLQANASDIRLLMLIAGVYEAKGQLDKAEEAYRNVLRIQPGNPLAANNLAYLMLENNDNIEVAFTLAQSARAGLPNAPTTADTLAWAYYKKSAYRNAIDLLEGAVQKNPANVSYHYHLGLAYQKNGDAAKAKVHLQRALQLDASFPHAEDARKTLSLLGSN